MHRLQTGRGAKRMKTRSIFLLNVLIGAVWVALQPLGGAADYFVGFLVGFALLAVMYRPYGRRLAAVVGFLVFLAWSIVKSSLQVAAYIVAIDPKLDQGIVAIPLDAESQLEIAALATAITLTPGTLSVDVGVDSSGRRILYVHNLVIGDPDAMRREIKQQFEQRILQATRGR